MDAAVELKRGRESYAARSWIDAHERLSHAGREQPLGAEDLELLAVSAYMIGRDDEYRGGLERAHQIYAAAGEGAQAIRCALWVGVNLAQGGEVSRASGWFARAQRMVERERSDCVERGYLLIPVIFRHQAGGDLDAACTTAGQAADIGEHFGDRDLFALAVHEQGHILVRQGQLEHGLALLDEAMVAVTAEELSPIVTGLVYCGVIAACQEAYALRRAKEWTAALTQWCAQQPDMVAFTGRCLVHRAEIMELRGWWPQALEEATRAAERCMGAANDAAAAEAVYRQGEVHRLQGEFAWAEEAYREAGRHGWEPQPGRALLRLAQGSTDAAATAIRRVVGETRAPAKRARLLPAYVEIMLAADDPESARDACRELAELADGYDRGMLGAMAAHARGSVQLAEGDAGAALVALREAWQGWQELEAPYEAARARVLVGLACRVLGDRDAATLELEDAREAFQSLGAVPDVARVDSLTGAVAAGDDHGLTLRELEVLRLVAAARTNKAIAAELVLSERTVDRHVSNIFAKLRVSSRAGATAYAYEHELL